MAETRRQYLERVSRIHDEWVQKHLDTAPFDPDSRPESGDYNQWNVDMDADAAAQDEFMKATAPPPEGFAPDPDYEMPETDAATGPG